MFSLAEAKQTILRVKRLRTAAPEDELILEAELPSQKRVKMDELMRSMMLGSSSGDATAGESAAAQSRRRRRFVLFTTTTEDLVQGDDGSALKKLLSSKAHAGLPGAVRERPTHEHGHSQSERPRYQQVKKQRRNNPSEAAPAAADEAGAREHFHIYELEQLQQEQQQGGGVDSHQVAVFMSMMEEFYQQQGAPVPEDISAAKQAALAGPAPTSGAAAVPTEASGSGGDSDMYIWDVYVPMEGAWEQGQEADEHGVAVVQVEGEDDMHWWEGLGDEEDGEENSEDSNAESYSGNTYPDETSSFCDEQEQCCASGDSNHDNSASSSSDDGGEEVRWDTQRQCTYVAPRGVPMPWEAVGVEDLDAGVAQPGSTAP